MSQDVNILDSAIARTRSRVLDYIELTKPELTFLSVLTTLCGFYLASRDFNVTLFVHTAIATALLGGGVGALNQYIEREYDAMMRRTERRPLPAGRLLPIEVLIFGAVCSVGGIMELALFTNQLTGFLAVLTFISYLFIYTPLKRVTPLSTLVGGIPGALPPMMGWTAARGSLDSEAWILFAILFCWQMPHFLSLAWMYRKDYARAGFKMLAAVDPLGKRTGIQVLFFTIILVPASIAMSFIGTTGKLYLAAAILLGGSFLYFGIMLMKHTQESTAYNQTSMNLWSRRTFYASLLYLPLLMIFMSLSRGS
jgi:protoheme IX farnesyltransferase